MQLIHQTNPLTNSHFNTIVVLILLSGGGISYAKICDKQTVVRIYRIYIYIKVFDKLT